MVDPTAFQSDRPTPHRPPRRLLALALIAAVLLLAADLLVVDPGRHLDGRGPLASLGGPDSIGVSADTGGAGRTVTFGLGLCLADPTEAVSIESIGPTVEAGSGVRFVGSRIRVLDWAAGPITESIGSVDGFPPPSIDPATLSEAVGSTVTHRCEHSNPTAYTELLLGFASDGSASGGWHGVDVGYRAGWRHRVVEIHYNLFLCLETEPDCLVELTAG